MREREYDFKDSLKQFIVEPGKNFRKVTNSTKCNLFIRVIEFILFRVKESTINNYANISHKNRLKFITKILAKRTQ